MKLALCIVALASFAARADRDTACARVSAGLTSAAVLQRCGQPSTIDSREEEWHADDGTVLAVDTVERWTYDLGPDRFIRILLLRNGLVTAVRTGGYGTSPRARAQRDCASARISVGDLKQDVLARCGDPIDVAVHAEAREAGPRTIYETVEEWVYDPGPGRFVRIFTFRSGRLIAIQTGGYGRAASAQDSSLGE